MGEVESGVVSGGWTRFFRRALEGELKITCDVDLNSAGVSV